MRASATRSSSAALRTVMRRPAALPHVVGQVERGAFENRFFIFPVVRQDDFFFFNMTGQIPYILPGFPSGRVFSYGTVPSLFPVDPAVGVGNRHQHVERAFTLRRQRGIRHAGILHVNGRILRQL